MGRGTNATTQAAFLSRCSLVRSHLTPAQGTAGGWCTQGLADLARVRSLRLSRERSQRWRDAEQAAESNDVCAKSARAYFAQPATMTSHQALARGFSLAVPVAGAALERSRALRKESKGNAPGRFQALSCYRNMTFTCFPSG